MPAADCRFRSMISPHGGSDNCRLSIANRRPSTVDLYLCAFDNAFLNSGSRSLGCLFSSFPPKDPAFLLVFPVFRSIAAGA